MKWQATFALVATLALGACSETVAPVPMEDTTPDYLWGGLGKKVKKLGAAVQSAVASAVPQNTLKHSTLAPPLYQTTASFTVVQGETADFTMYYANPLIGGPGLPFLRIDVPATAQFVDEHGTPLADGDELELTVELDPVYFLVKLGPHGSTFETNDPLTLTFNMLFADPGSLTASALTLWYQATEGTTWSALNTPLLDVGLGLQAPVYHFSNYAVAW